VAIRSGTQALRASAAWAPATRWLRTTSLSGWAFRMPSVRGKRRAPSFIARTTCSFAAM
jgi:hypothetical protein